MRYVIIAILALVWAFFGCPGWLSDGSSWWLRAATYHFFHANLFHLLTNCVAVWTIFRKVPWRTGRDMVRELCIGYAIATLMYATAFRPIVGISNVLFAVMGLRAPSFRSEWWRMNIPFFAICLLTVFIPRVSAVTHLTSMGLGIACAEAGRRLKSLNDDYGRAGR